MSNSILTLLILVPMIGALLVLLPRDRGTVRWLALGVTIATFLLSLLLLVYFDWHKGTSYAYANDGGTVQLVQDVQWIPSFNVHYKVGIDGLSLPLVLLTTFICVLSCIASWNIEKMTKGYMALFLFLEA